MTLARLLKRVSAASCSTGLCNFTYTGRSKDLTTTTSYLIRGIVSTGDYLYLLDANGSGNAFIRQYTWTNGEADTLALNASSGDIASTTANGNPNNIDIDPTFKEFYVTVGGEPPNTNPDSIVQYEMSIANDLSTLSYSGNNKNLAGQTTNPRGGAYNSDGSKLWVGDVAELFAYTSSGPNYSPSSLVYDSISKDISSISPNFQEYKPNADSSIIYGADRTNKRVVELSMSTPGDITTITEGESLDVSTESAGNIIGMCFSPDFLKCYVVDATNGILYEYSS